MGRNVRAVCGALREPCGSTEGGTAANTMGSPEGAMSALWEPFGTLWRALRRTIYGLGGIPWKPVGRPLGAL